MNSQNVEIDYNVKVKYSLEAGASFCQQSANANLLAAIENERTNGALTPDDISADWVECEIKNCSKTNLSVNKVSTEGKANILQLLKNTYCFFTSSGESIIIDLRELEVMEKRDGLFEEVVETLENENVIFYENDTFLHDYLELHT